MSLLHLVQRHIDGVEQRGPALGLREGQPVLDLLQVGGEILDKLRTIVELHQKELIFRICRFEKHGDSLTRLGQLVSHAAAGVENQTNRKRRVLAGKMDNLLLDLVLEQPEVLLLEAGHKPVERIGHRDVDQYDGCIDADIRTGPFRSRYDRFGPRIDCNLRAVRARANGYHQQARGEE